MRVNGLGCRIYGGSNQVGLGHATRMVDVRLPGQGNSNSHSARPVHLIITMIKWIRTSRLSIKNSFSVEAGPPNHLDDKVDADQ